MDRLLACECGFEARAPDEDELIAQVRRHAQEAHHMALSHAQALLLTRNSSSQPTDVPQDKASDST
jgi:hypothetical protein